MNHDIESFLHIMQEILPMDIIKHIVTLICIDSNIAIIKKQKQLKIKLNHDIIKLFNTYYYDNNFLLYRNEHNQFILENISLNNKHIYVCSNRQAISNEHQNNDINQIVLFEQPTDVEYDENGLPIQRRIRLDVVYVP
jgi:hypothetical protein